MSLRSDDGMSTVEYAVCTLAAAAFALVLYTVAKSDTVSGGIADLIARALGGV